MKKIKTIVSLFCTFIFLFAITNTVNAESVPNSITVKRAEVLNDIVANHDHGFTIFTTNEGKIIYCMDVDKTALVSGQKASLAGDGDAGLLYILQNGYPNKKITGNDQADKYITQAAIWWYLDESKLSDNFKNATTTDTYKVIPKIKALVSAARGAKDTQALPSITFTNNGTTLTLTSDGKYYESSFLAAAVTGATTYNVVLNGATKNAVIVDEEGNIGTTMNSSEKFKVRIPAADVKNNTTITVKVSATGTIQKAKIYKPSDTSYQRVVGLYSENKDVEKQVTLSAIPAGKHVCQYTNDKYYGKDGSVVSEKEYKKQCGHICKYIDGKYYGRNGDIVGKKTYESECQYVCQYTDGKYYGSDGSIVDKDTYDQQCGQEVVVPNTDSNIIMWSVLLGVVLIGGGIIFILFRDNFKKIGHKE